MPESVVRVITHNTAGGIEPHLGDPIALAPARKQMVDFGPVDLVLLQEICYTGQYLAMRDAYPTWNWRFAVSRVSHPGCGDGTYGTVLGSPRPLLDVQSYDLPYWSHDREQRILCATIEKGGAKIRAGVVHMKVKWAADQSEEYYGRPNGTEQAAQMEKIVEVTSPFKARGPVIIGGDFNAPMHSGVIQSMKDAYDEVNQGSEDSGRIDHIWAGGKYVAGLMGSIVSGGDSDHPLVRGTVRIVT